MSACNSTKATVRAVAYYRVSTDHREGSIPQQQEAMRPRAEAAGLEIVKEFKDDGISGGGMTKRDAFNAMLAFCQAQKKQGTPISAVVCWDTNRFSRADSIETSHYVHEFREAGVWRLFTFSEDIDFRQDAQRVFFHMKQDMSNNRFLVDLSRNVTRGKLAAYGKKRWNGGAAPYGFDRMLMDQKDQPVKRITRKAPLGFKERGWYVRLTPSEGEPAEIVRWLYREFVTTETSCRALTKILNQRKIDSPGSKAGWSMSAVQRILSNPAYVGDLQYGHESQGKFHRIVGGEMRATEKGARPHYNDNPPVIPDAHEAIIDRPTWDAVQKKLKSRRAKKWKPQGGGYVLSGIVRCGHCGSLMYGDGQKSRHGDKPGKNRITYRYYQCCGDRKKPAFCRRYRIREDRLLPCLLQKLQAAYLDPKRQEGLRGQLAERVEQRQQGDPKKALRLRKQLADLDGDIQQGVKNLIRAKDNLDLLQAAVSELRAKREAVGQELQALEAVQDVPDDEAAQKVTGAMERLNALREALLRARPEQLRALLTAFLSRVDLYFEEKGQRGKRLVYGFARGIARLRPTLPGMEDKSDELRRMLTVAPVVRMRRPWPRRHAFF
jgi:site-specific DNA recombinase